MLGRLYKRNPREYSWIAASRHRSRWLEALFNTFLAEDAGSFIQLAFYSILKQSFRSY
jgi:hypothetical protein